MFRFDNATRGWSWHIVDPDLGATNNLAGLSSGDLVWIRTTGTVTVNILGEPITLSCTGEGTAGEDCWNQVAIAQHHSRRSIYIYRNPEPGGTGSDQDLTTPGQWSTSTSGQSGTTTPRSPPAACQRLSMAVRSWAAGAAASSHQSP